MRASRMRAGALLLVALVLALSGSAAAGGRGGKVSDWPSGSLTGATQHHHPAKPAGATRVATSLPAQALVLTTEHQR